MKRDASSWIQTYSGCKFWPLDPRPEDVHLVDIAHALSNVGRFAGHLTEHFSVAQHSVLVSSLCPPESQLWGLFHDAAEAYIGDISRAIKHALELVIPEDADGVREIETRILKAIADRFGFTMPVPPAVWYADNVLLATEARDLLPGGPLEGWTAKLPQPLHEKIVPWGHEVAKHRFLRLAAELGVGVA